MPDTVLYPLVGGTIGYLTNVIAIRMVISWVLPRKRYEISHKVVDDIIPGLLPKYMGWFSPLRRRLKHDAQRLLDEAKIVDFIRMIYSSSRLELRFIEFIGGVIGAGVGGILLLF